MHDNVKDNDNYNGTVNVDDNVNAVPKGRWVDTGDGGY